MPRTASTPPVETALRAGDKPQLQSDAPRKGRDAFGTLWTNQPAHFWLCSRAISSIFRDSVSAKLRSAAGAMSSVAEIFRLVPGEAEREALQIVELTSIGPDSPSRRAKQAASPFSSGLASRLPRGSALGPRSVFRRCAALIFLTALQDESPSEWGPTLIRHGSEAQSQWMRSCSSSGRPKRSWSPTRSNLRRQVPARPLALDGNVHIFA